ncbi:MAG: hypothetical protein DRG78_07455 [Epsilonproteobacteria bacterium]|nr:MAG: hypothetical protein DRG78_07455 [Campylobacterota bacterium]
MKIVFQILVFSFIVTLFSGCFCKHPEILVQTKTEYIQHIIPNIDQAPKGLVYNVQYIKINNTDYYLMTLDDGTILINNWTRYKIWSENNYNILKDLKKIKDK